MKTEHQMFCDDPSVTSWPTQRKSPDMGQQVTPGHSVETRKGKPFSTDNFFKEMYTLMYGTDYDEDVELVFGVS